MGLSVNATNLDWNAGDTIRFVIPLGCLSVFFNTCDQLVPAQLASGMRIELLLEDGKQAMVQSAATATASAFEISNATLNLQSYLLSDVVLRYTLLHKHKNTRTTLTSTHIHSHHSHT